MKKFTIAGTGVVAAAPWVGAVVGNLVGGFTFTGFAIYVTYKPRTVVKVLVPTPTGIPAE